MNPERRAIADEIYAHGREFDAQQSNRLERLRNLQPETAELLAVLIRATGARRILEVGTSNGYSTLWLADAVATTGGHVESLDIDPRRSDQARANIARAGLDGLATCRTASAAQALIEYPRPRLGPDLPRCRALRVRRLLAQRPADPRTGRHARDRQRDLARRRAV